MTKHQEIKRIAVQIIPSPFFGPNGMSTRLFKFWFFLLAGLCLSTICKKGCPFIPRTTAFVLGIVGPPSRPFSSSSSSSSSSSQRFQGGIQRRFYPKMVQTKDQNHHPQNSFYPVKNQETIRLAQEQLAKYFSFPLDDWQLQAGGEIILGHNVIVCAPTGSGKTVVGEMALHYAYSQQQRNGIYTTPLKALSNQKFAELRHIFGRAHVGLSTGDISINRRHARITVMTTEVYRNIAWRSSGKQPSLPPSTISPNATTVTTTTTPSSFKDQTSSKQGILMEREMLYRDELDQNAVVVLDEFHYMGLPGRGGVWEECVITSPSHTQIIGLSATLSNAAQLANWMEGVTGRKTVLVEAPKARPVPLRYLYATREGLYPLFRNPDAGPGAPLGLLGYRDDGIPPAGSTIAKRKKKGFGSKNDRYGSADSDTDYDVDDDDDDDDIKSEGDVKLPRGLQVNPALKAAAQRRMQKVNRRLEQQKQRQRQRMDNPQDEWDLYSGGRERIRRWEYGKMSPREERKERERLLKSEMRKAVPSLPILLIRLKEKKLLPAIFFIFSRAGCDQAAHTITNSYKGPRDPNQDIDFEGDWDEDDADPPTQQGTTKIRKTRQRSMRLRGNTNLVEDAGGRKFRLDSDYISEDVFNSVFDGEAFSDDAEFDASSPLSSENWNFYKTAGLLNYDEVRMVASRVGQFNEDNPEIAFADEIIEQYLFGVGSHHAGMLPAHKAFVETLFRGNLMKAVFATETLAAGINMPARTTVICALAKRGDGSSMNLLETSNLLQMAGRAGRRGIDTAGTCVIMATPFESHDDAARILTNPVEPIVSQFRPSYSLAVNLIARGGGRLDVAKQLVRKSFAMWEKSQLERDISSATERDGVSEILEASVQEKFMNVLMDVLQRQVDQKNARFDISYLQTLLVVLKDRELLKKSSKSYLGAARMLELETTTLNYLELELKDLSSSVGLQAIEGQEFMEALLDEEQKDLMDQIEIQRKRAMSARKEVKKHPFSVIASIANEIMEGESRDGRELFAALRNTRDLSSGQSMLPLSLTAEELCEFSKSSVIIKRKLRKVAASNPDLEPEKLLLQAAKVENMKVDDSWDDMLAITKVLVSYGCLMSERTAENGFEDQTFKITPAGVDVGMLGFENSLWCYVSMGGTWDVIGASSKLDDFKVAMDAFANPVQFYDDAEKEAISSNEGTDQSPDKSNIPLPQQEAEQLITHLRFLSPAELAGYVSCLVSEGSRGGNPSVLETFQKLTPRQQRAIQVALGGMERLTDVQRQYSVDERTGNCPLDITNCEVVTAWADGCTWSDALALSGAAPGDLARIISRALDAVRQFGNLKFTPFRKGDLLYSDGSSAQLLMPRGIHPEIRRLCREAAESMNRYPVKDPLPFEVVEDDDVDDGMNDDDGDDEENDGVDVSTEQEVAKDTTISDERNKEG